jgi:hypothetical protein
VANRLMYDAKARGKNSVSIRGLILASGALLRSVESIWTSRIEAVDRDGTRKVAVLRENALLSYTETIQGLRNDQAFRNFFSRCWRKCSLVQGFESRRP